MPDWNTIPDLELLLSGRIPSTISPTLRSQQGSLMRLRGFPEDLARLESNVNFSNWRSRESRELMKAGSIEEERE